MARPRLRHVIIGAVLITGIACHTKAASASAEPAPAPAPAPHSTCVMFEDDSFVCGRALPSGGVDRSWPYVVGCIPDGLCSIDEARREGY